MGLHCHQACLPGHRRQYTLHCLCLYSCTRQSMALRAQIRGQARTMPRLCSKQHCRQGMRLRTQVTRGCRPCSSSSSTRRRRRTSSAGCVASAPQGVMQTRRHSTRQAHSGCSSCSKRRGRRRGSGTPMQAHRRPPRCVSPAQQRALQARTPRCAAAPRVPPLGLPPRATRHLLALMPARPRPWSPGSQISPAF